MFGVGEEPTTPCEHKADSLNSLPISFHQASPKKMWVMTSRQRRAPALERDLQVASACEVASRWKKREIFGGREVKRRERRAPAVWPWFPVQFALIRKNTRFVLLVVVMRNWVFAMMV